MSKLDDLLEQFRGKSADEIAAMVKRRGIKGRMGTTYGCPMALWCVAAALDSLIRGHTGF